MISAYSQAHPSIVRRRPWITPAHVTGVATLVALITVVLKLVKHHYDPTVFADIDGRFVLNLARTFPSLRAELDVAPYRAQRILLSALAAPWGVHAAWGILAVNIAALAAGTYALALLAQQQNMSPVLGLLFGLWLGSFYALHLDLTEVLTYALILWAIVFWERQQFLGTAALCGVAALAKETAVLYGLAFALAPSRGRSAGCLGPAQLGARDSSSASWPLGRPWSGRGFSSRPLARMASEQPRATATPAKACGPLWVCSRRKPRTGVYRSSGCSCPHFLPSYGVCGCCCMGNGHPLR